MFLILLTTMFSGALFSKLLLLTGIIDIRFRYPLIAVLSYLVFFMCIKMWLYFMMPARLSGNTGAGGLLDVPVFGSGVRAGDEAISPGGGEFLGAGASGDFDAPETAAAASIGISDNAASVSSGGEAAGDGIGNVVDALGDSDGIGVIIILAVFVATILGSTLFVIYSAPAILAEAAFQGILVASLAKKTRSVTDGVWVRSILRDTWKPFAVTLGIIIAISIALHVYFPHAARLADVFRTLRGN